MRRSKSSRQKVLLLGLGGITTGFVLMAITGLHCSCSKEGQVDIKTDEAEDITRKFTQFDEISYNEKTIVNGIKLKSREQSSGEQRAEKTQNKIVEISGLDQFINEKQLVAEMNSTIHFYPYGSIKKQCDQIDYESLGRLPKTSVVLTFYNGESLDKLLRTIRSILKWTPKELLEEIVLIADNVTKDDLTTVLDQQIKAINSNIITLRRSGEQLGLIKARLMGIRVARGPVVVCLDSHMEVNERWIEPLVLEILRNPRTLACPSIDWISFNETDQRWTMKYGGYSWVTFFDWTLGFGWQDMSAFEHKRMDVTSAYNSPMVIGVFGIAKKWFMEIGEFDEGMEAWGGENVDLSLRVWLFGGRVVNVPCSRVAHDETPGARDYRAPWTNLIQRNTKRVVEVWFDDYKKYLYYYHPNMALMDAHNLSARFKLKKRAKHNFKWFLDNVYPQLGMHDVNSLAYNGAINLGYPKKCFDGGGQSFYKLDDCNEAATVQQNVYWNMKGDLRYPTYRSKPLYDLNELRYKVWGDGVILSDQSEQNAVWFHWKDGPLIEARTNLCLDAIPDSELFMSKCQFTKKSQQWRFTTYTKEYLDLDRGGSDIRYKSAYLFQLSNIINAAKEKKWIEIQGLTKNYKKVKSKWPAPIYNTH